MRVRCGGLAATTHGGGAWGAAERRAPTGRKTRRVRPRRSPCRGPDSLCGVCAVPRRGGRLCRPRGSTRATPVADATPDDHECPQSAVRLVKVAEVSRRRQPPTVPKVVRAVLATMVRAVLATRVRDEQASKRLRCQDNKSWDTNGTEQSVQKKWDRLQDRLRDHIRREVFLHLNNLRVRQQTPHWATRCLHWDDCKARARPWIASLNDCHPPRPARIAAADASAAASASTPPGRRLSPHLKRHRRWCRRAARRAGGGACPVRGRHCVHCIATAARARSCRPRVRTTASTTVLARLPLPPPGRALRPICPAWTDAALFCSSSLPSPCPPPAAGIPCLRLDAVGKRAHPRQGSVPPIYGAWVAVPRVGRWQLCHW